MYPNTVATEQQGCPISGNHNPVIWALPQTKSVHKACSFQATANTSRHHAQAQCEVSGEQTSEQQSRDYRWGFFCGHTSVWWKQEMGFTGENLIQDLGDTNLNEVELQRQWNWRTSLGTLPCCWNSPVKQSIKKCDVQVTPCHFTNCPLKGWTDKRYISRNIYFIACRGI